MSIWSFLFGMDDTGEEARDYIAKNCKEGVDPRSNIGDYGDFNEDHNQSDHNHANGRATNRDSSGVGLPTSEETERYYDSLRYTDIKIIGREDKK